MKRFFSVFLVISLCFIFFGCNSNTQKTQILATTLSVYEFTSVLCENTSLCVTRLITENVSCLHDYTLQVKQMRDIESCDTVVISGAGFEGFLENNLLESKQIIDASLSISLLCSAGSHHSEHNDNHIQDSHIWLSIENAKMMTENIRDGLSEQYPEYKSTFNKNYIILNEKLTELSEYAKTQLDDLSCRNIITFHDGFTYLANDFNLNIVHAIEEESGSEASAAELIKLTEIIEKYGMNSIFTEINGSTSAAEIIAAETGVKTFALDMAISGESYFAAMKHNIDTLKEALE